MKKDILSEEQKELMPFIKTFSKEFYLVEGTALALQIGHRRSIDFDLFTDRIFAPIKIRNKIIQDKKTINHIFSQGEGEYTVLVNKVKITFFYYPFNIEKKRSFEGIKMPDILTIGAMKSFVLGKRAKWKDYVDLYFIFQKYSLKEVVKKAKRIYKNEFNEKLFRSQLCYFDDIDYSEIIDYMPGFEKDDLEIKKFLEKISLS